MKGKKSWSIICRLSRIIKPQKADVRLFFYLHTIKEAL